MSDNRNIRITIHPVETKSQEYVAYFESQFLQAQFCVYLKDAIFGAMALHAFAEMVKKAFGKNYRTGEITFQVSQQPVPFCSRPILDILDSSQSAFCALK